MSKYFDNWISIRTSGWDAWLRTPALTPTPAVDSAYKQQRRGAASATVAAPRVRAVHHSATTATVIAPNKTDCCLKFAILPP